MHFLNPFVRRTFGASLPAVAGAVLCTPVHAGRPLVTGETAIVERGACQLEFWHERSCETRALWADPGLHPFGATELSRGGARLREDGERASATPGRSSARGAESRRWNATRQANVGLVLDSPPVLR